MICKHWSRGLRESLDKPCAECRKEVTAEELRGGTPAQPDEEQDELTRLQGQVDWTAQTR